MNKYLESSTYIDWHNPQIQELAKNLKSLAHSNEQIIKITFEWVRDNVLHSSDYRLNPVTCKASDVLQHKTGYCYAKSHLLAALLRANSIECGLCYQRLTVSGDDAPYCLHGLNAVRLENGSWYRIDARGNKDGVNAEFCPPEEKLAFQILHPQEMDLPEIWPSPLPQIIEVLEKYHHWKDVHANLPDIDLLTLQL